MEPPRTVRIQKELRHVLEDRKILEADLCRTIEHAEESGDFIEDHSNGHRTSSLRLACATYWVEYSEHDGAYVVHDAYSHRFTAESEEIREAAAGRGSASTEKTSSKEASLR